MDFHVFTYVYFRKSSKHETDMTPAELYLARDLMFSLDLMYRNPLTSKEGDSVASYIASLKREMKKIHEGERVEMKSSRTKCQLQSKGKFISR